MISPDEFANQMEKISKDMYGDQETSHMYADSLMCYVLNQLGYQEGVEIFEKMPKWYA